MKLSRRLNNSQTGAIKKAPGIIKGEPFDFESVKGILVFVCFIDHESHPGTGSVAASASDTGV